MKIIKVPYLSYYIVQGGSSFYQVYDLEFRPVGLTNRTFYECKLMIDELVYQENYRNWSSVG